jgi:hypothetical protein
MDPEPPELAAGVPRSMTINHELSTICFRPFRTTDERERYAVGRHAPATRARARPSRCSNGLSRRHLRADQQ